MKYRCVSGVNDFATKHPEMINEWDNELNGDLTPYLISYGSEKKVWWNCSKGHKYEMTVYSKHLGAKCPICSGRILQKGINDLVSTYPELINEWDFEKNNIVPNTVHSGSKLKVWWKCAKGHSWSTGVQNRTRNGNGCPVCSGKRILTGYNDLGTRYPELLLEWDYEANTDADPKLISPNSKKKVWWKCSRCHYSWNANVHNRTFNKSGCPKCNKNASSFAEQAVYYYIKTYFPSAVNSYRDIFMNSMELDVYIPELKCGIEYDGQAWHKGKNNISRSKRKYQICKDNDVKLIRIAEEGIDVEVAQLCDAFFVRKDSISDRSLEEVIRILLRYLQVDGDVDIKRDQSLIYGNIAKFLKKKSLSSVYPKIAKIWDYTNNDGILPENVYANTSRKWWFVCKENHHFQSTIPNMKKDGTTCPICSGKQVLSGFNDLKTKYPTVAAEWDYEKNTPYVPEMVMPGTPRKYWWRCKKGHSFIQTVNSRTSNDSGCPICNKGICYEGVNDILTLYPEIITEEWDYSLNKVNPATIGIGSNIGKVWWKCKEGHRYQQSVYLHLKENSGCRICNNRELLTGWNDIQTKAPSIVKEWDTKKNVVSPSEVMYLSQKKYWWKCCTCGCEWQISPRVRVRSDTGCPACSGQLTVRGINTLFDRNPELLEEWDYDKNQSLDPREIYYKSTKKAWWKCRKCSYEWETKISRRTDIGVGCPVCHKRRVWPGHNDLETLNPILAAEWNYEKNGELLPNQIMPGSNKKVWWKCRNCMNEWEAIVQNRNKGTGCPACRKRVK